MTAISAAMPHPTPMRYPPAVLLGPAELRARRELLGLSAATLANLLGVVERTVFRWENKPDRSEYNLTPEICGKVDQLTDFTEDLVTALIREHRCSAAALTTYRTDRKLAEAQPHYAHLGAQWHRMVCARVSREVPTVKIRYA